MVTAEAELIFLFVLLFVALLAGAAVGISLGMWIVLFLQEHKMFLSFRKETFLSWRQPASSSGAATERDGETNGHLAPTSPNRRRAGTYRLGRCFARARGDCIRRSA